MSGNPFDQFSAAPAQAPAPASQNSFDQFDDPGQAAYQWHTYVQKDGKTVAVPIAPPDAPVSAGGEAKAAGSGLLTGLTGASDLLNPANIVDNAALTTLRLMHQGKTADALQPYSPTTATGAAQTDGLDYQPQNTAERYTKSIFQMAPNTALGPEGVLPRVASVVLPGVLSQGASDATAAMGGGPMAQGAARFVGGVLGGLGAGGLAAAGKVTAPDIIPSSDAPVASAVRKALALGQSTPDDVNAALNRGVLPVASSPGLAGLGEAVASTPGPGGVLLRHAISERMGSQTDRALQTATDVLGVDPNAARGDVRSIVEAGRAQAAPIYKSLTDNPAPVMTPELAKLAQTPAVKKAISFAVDDMLNDVRGPSPTALGFKLDPDTGAWTIPDSSSLTGVAEQQPTAATWIKVHQALGNTVQRSEITNKPIPDADSPGNANISKVGGYLKEALAGDPETGDGAAIPGYGDALKTSSDYLSVNGAYNRAAGKLFNGPVSNVQDLWSSLKTDPERDAVRSAMANDVLELADRNQNGIQPGRFMAPGVQKKLAIAFGPDKAQSFVDQMESDLNERQTYNQITGNSRTMPRAALVAEYQKPASGGVLGKALGGAEWLQALAHPPLLMTKIARAGLAKATGAGKTAVLPWEDPDTAVQLGGVLGSGDQMKGLLGRMAAQDAAVKSMQDAQRLQLLTQPTIGGMLQYQPQQPAPLGVLGQ